MLLIDGKKIAAQIEAEAKTLCASLVRQPHLAVILVGSNTDSLLYVEKKREMAARIGVMFSLFNLPDTATFAEVRGKIEELNADPSVDAILLQLPLPLPLDSQRKEIVSCISPAKDVDGFHPQNIAAYIEGADNPDVHVLPPVLIASILRMLETTGVSFSGTSAAILGNTDVFTRPLEAGLRRLGVNTVTWVGNDPDAMTAIAALKDADIVITALGKPHVLRGEHIKKGAAIIDVGTRRIEGVTHGDVNAASMEHVAAFLTPVPGGVGPVTVATMLHTVVRMSAANQASHQ